MSDNTQNASTKWKKKKLQELEKLVQAVYAGRGIAFS